MSLPVLILLAALGSLAIVTRSVRAMPMYWSLVNSTNLSYNGASLSAIAPVSANDIWAVGTFNTSTGPSIAQTLIEHWSGAAWSIVPGPDAGTEDVNMLSGVTAVSASNVWAVGHYIIASNNDYQTLIEHWNGTTWSVVSSPNGSYDDHLYGVAAVASNDIWAVGNYYTSAANAQQTLIEHWNGTAWSIMPSPNVTAVGGDFLTGVAAVSASDVWAVGYDGGAATVRTLIEQWNETAWSVVPSPDAPKNRNDGIFQNALNGVAVVSARDVWAVGASYGGDGALIEHYGYLIAPAARGST